jgi:ubiquinone/menaquinone biosynthesis C-methylase UbiE
MKGRESGMPEDAYWSSFFNPSCIVTKLDCGERIGDGVEFGCGYGTFSLAAAERVRGSLVCLDIDPSMVTATVQKATDSGLKNVVGQVRDFVSDGSGLADASASYAMLFNILHIENPVGLLREALRVLVPGGKVGVIHWRTDIATPRGPSLSIRPSAEQCRKWSAEAELDFVRYESLGCCFWHWGMVLQRSRSG